MTAPVGMRTPVESRSGLIELLRHPRYEVFPLEGIDDQVAAHVPPSATLTVTASPRRGLGATLDLAERLVRAGYAVVPHLSARLVTDEVELKDILDRLDDLAVREAFVVGGDPDRPVGRYTDALQLLVAMAELGRRPAAVGIAGYPESHPKIPDDVLVQAMWDKRQHATYVVSQLCFDPVALARWVHRIRRRGVDLPLYVGVPGPVALGPLLGLSRRVGVGESARFVGAHGMGLLRLGRPGRYRPDRLLARLGGLRPYIHGVHLYTFNDMAGAERWRQSWLTSTPKEW